MPESRCIIAMALGCLLLTACGGGGGDGTTASASAYYVPTASFGPGGSSLHDITYTDLAGDPRTVRIEVRWPSGTEGPVPVVLWSHGSGDGRLNPLTVGVSWGRTFVQAGYAFVAIAHLPRVVDDMTDERSALCAALGITTCASFKYLNWDRPHDVAAVLDFLDAQARGDWSGRFDLSRLAYCGHSAGGGAALMIAGATREFAGVPRRLADHRIRACISCSPQGPGEEDFTTTSFDSVDRPHLTLTGAGDDTNGSVAENRRLPFELMPAGDKYRGWITEESARHTLYNAETQACEDFGETAARCEEMIGWLASVAVAFLDAYVRDDPAAAAYLRSEAPMRLGGAAFAWAAR